MSWQSVVELFRREMDGATARRVETAMLAELGGKRISIPGRARPKLTDAEVQKALRSTGWRVDEAAKTLGIHPATLYRFLRTKLPKPKPRGRLVR